MDSPAITFLTVAICSALAVLLRLYTQICASRARRRAAIHRQISPTTTALPPTPPPASRVLCVLGSGGHTAEMLVLISDLLRSPACPSHIFYLATATDDHSLKKAHQLHLVTSARARSPAAPVPLVVFEAVPRAREVHQSWASTAASAARCLAAAVPAVARARPDLVLVNGPGSAVVVAAVVLMLNAIGCLRARIAYVESVARTRSLSLSGRILYPVVDRFVVQWPGLQERYPVAEFHGRLT